MRPWICALYVAVLFTAAAAGPGFSQQAGIPAATDLQVQKELWDDSAFQTPYRPEIGDDELNGRPLLLTRWVDGSAVVSDLLGDDLGRDGIRVGQEVAAVDGVLWRS
jgi:hypothetical protein